MENKKIIAMIMTLSMLAAAFAGCLGGEDEPEPEWALSVADDVSADFVTSDWDPIIPNLNDGEMCDAILSAMTKTDERELVVDFTRGYYTSSQGVIGASGSAMISDALDLNAAGTRVAVQSGTTSDLWTADNLPDATIVAYADFPSVTASISNGDADYAIGDSPVMALSGDLMVTFSDETFGLAVAGTDDSDEMRNTELLDALNVAITALVDSGEYDAIFGAWFEGAVVLTDDRTADTATSYPTPTEGSSLTAVLESGSLKFCSDTSYPPFENLDADGNAEGFDVDIGNAIADEIAFHYAGVASNDAYGCMDSEATNYDSAANLDDDSCTYPAEATKLGLLIPRTGPVAGLIGPAVQAAAMAVADLNAMGGNFEIIEADSGCNGETATTGAQTLADAGVVGVIGAVCSAASHAANAILSAAGIPMISPTSRDPALSMAPDFYRVVPPATIQGPAMVTLMMSEGFANPALVYMTNDYGAGMGAVIGGYWAGAGGSVCTEIGYDEMQTDFSAEIQAIADAGCDSMVLVSYTDDGLALLEQMAFAGLGIPVIGMEALASEEVIGLSAAPYILNGLIAVKSRAASSFGDFNERCAADAECAGGVYTAETYDSVMIMGTAAMMEDGANMAEHMGMIGTYEGASGSHTFDANGDVAGSGFEFCTFDALSSVDVYFGCYDYWTLTGGMQETPFTGMTVKIGFLNPMTGPIAVYAPGFGVAANIALEMMNIGGWGAGLQFELVMVDSGCDGDVAAAGAQALIDAGVVGVVGAACSGATIAANAILSAAGIPMISYASTSPDLSDASAFPLFFRVVPSDAIQGPALADVVAADGGSTVALLHMSNDYGSGLADSFEAAWTADGTALCAKIGYDPLITDFTSQVQSVISANCDSVMLVSYAADGAAIVEELSIQGFTGLIFGGDGVAEEGLAADMADTSVVDGIVATKPASAVPSERSMAFAAICAEIPDCAGGIYTAEAFDAMLIMGYSVFAQLGSPAGTPLGAVIPAVGNNFVGASGLHTFDAVGDVAGNGYCVGTFSVAADGAVSFDCTRYWSRDGGLVTA
jgi:branched-chain amino acid transport system substrate-binding protein